MKSMTKGTRTTRTTSSTRSMTTKMAWMGQMARVLQPRIVATKGTELMEDLM